MGVLHPTVLGTALQTRALRIRHPSYAIYGTVVAASIVAGEAAADIRVAEIALSVLVTATIYWLAHTYVDVLGEQAREADVGEVRLGARALVGTALADQWPIIGGAASVVAVLLFATFAGADVAVASDAALWFAVTQLGGWGLVAAHRSGANGKTSALYALAGASFGLAIVVLKGLLHH